MISTTSLPSRMWQAAATLFLLRIPFTEKIKIDCERLLNWLNQYEAALVSCTVSAHTMPLQLKEMN